MDASDSELKVERRPAARIIMLVVAVGVALTLINHPLAAVYAGAGMFLLMIVQLSVITSTKSEWACFGGNPLYELKGDKLLAARIGVAMLVSVLATFLCQLGWLRIGI